MPLGKLSITIIGSGNMGEALIRGLLAASAVSPAQLVATDVDPERLDLISSKYGVRTTSENFATARRRAFHLPVNSNTKTRRHQGVVAGT